MHVACKEDSCSVCVCACVHACEHVCVCVHVYDNSKMRLISFQRISNYAKEDVMANFLEFVDSNSQPNGRQAGSYSAQYFFHPKFTRVAPPSTSIVAEFNRAQREMDRGTCGPTAASEWLKAHYPNVALHPSMTDYCDTCKNLKEELSRHQAIINRLHQSGSTSESNLHACEEAKQHLEKEIKQHKEVTTKAREQYKSCKEWMKIMELSKKTPLNPSERGELEAQMHCFTLTISAEYQQSKLIPSSGSDRTAWFPTESVT